MKTKIQMKQSLLLLLAAVIWGVAFVAQSVGMDHVGPFTFNALRSLLGGVFLIPCIFLLGKLNGEKQVDLLPREKTERKQLLTGGVLCGCILCAATNLQQIGILYTTVGKAGFITACYIVLVPIFGMFLGKKTGMGIWISVGLAVVGLYLLCLNDSLVFGKGDLYVLGCAVLFAWHILTIDHFTELVDGVRMSCIQFLVSGNISSIFMFLFEKPSLEGILQAGIPILYAGILSSGVAYTLQIVGQKGMNPTVASLILSLESCISVLAGWLLLKQALSLRELLGCAVMFGAILMAQIPSGKKAEKGKTQI